jgi:hypothetical protein
MSDYSFNKKQQRHVLVKQLYLLCSMCTLENMDCNCEHAVATATGPLRKLYGIFLIRNYYTGANNTSIFMLGDIYSFFY